MWVHGTNETKIKKKIKTMEKSTECCHVLRLVRVCKSQNALIRTANIWATPSSSFDCMMRLQESQPHLYTELLL